MPLPPLICSERIFFVSLSQISTEIKANNNRVSHCLIVLNQRICLFPPFNPLKAGYNWRHFRHLGPYNHFKDNQYFSLHSDNLSTKFSPLLTLKIKWLFTCTILPGTCSISKQEPQNPRVSYGLHTAFQPARRPQNKTTSLVFWIRKPRLRVLCSPVTPLPHRHKAPQRSYRAEPRVREGFVPPH